MAHFAKLDENNKVIEVQIIQNDRILDNNDNESEEIGIEICKREFGGTKWIQTSYNGSFRGIYAGLGSYYLENEDIFTYPKPHDSFILDPEDHFYWIAPVERPSSNPEGFVYVWNENIVDWELQEILPPPPKIIELDSFRSQLTLNEKLLWDNPDTASTLSQKSVITTFKNELPLTIGNEITTELLDLLVSEGVFTQQRLDEIISKC